MKNIFEFLGFKKKRTEILDDEVKEQKEKYIKSELDRRKREEGIYNKKLEQRGKEYGKRQENSN